MGKASAKVSSMGMSLMTSNCVRSPECCGGKFSTCQVSRFSRQVENLPPHRPPVVSNNRRPGHAKWERLEQFEDVGQGVLPQRQTPGSERRVGVTDRAYRRRIFRCQCKSRFGR